MTRHEVLEQACEQCLKELYTKVQPAVTWEDIVEQNKIYSNKYKAWERYHRLSNQEALSEEELREFSTYPGEWKNKSKYDCIGPAPYEFYYLPKDVMKSISDSYVYAYNIDAHQNLLDIIDILKKYFESPIIDKYIEGENGSPGYKGYDHPDNFRREVTKLLNMYFGNSDNDLYAVAEDIEKILYDFFDMAGEFYTWKHDLSYFNTIVYLGPSPCSNKEQVIENWKIYRNEDITIDDSVYIEDED